MRIFLGIFFILMVGAIQSQNQLIPFDRNATTIKTTEPTRKITDNGLDGLIVRYDFSGAVMHHKIFHQQVFYQYYIKNFSQTQEEGKPMLPAHTDLVFIPDGVDFSISILNHQSFAYNNFPTRPVSKQESDQFGDIKAPLRMDIEAYQSSYFYPENLVQVKGFIKIKGARIAIIEVHPMQYKASDNSLRVNSTIEYKVHFEPHGQLINFDNYELALLKTICNSVLNNQYLKPDLDFYIENNKHKFIHREEPNYIILTHQDYKVAADSLAKWKSQLGFRTKIISNINWTANDIKNELNKCYHSQKYKPEYLVLLGDIDKVPTINFDPSDESKFSDLYYACFDGLDDIFPDVAMGRISVSNPQQALSVIQKIINYERRPCTDQSFYNSVSAIANFSDNGKGTSQNRHVQTTEEINAYLSTQNYKFQKLYSASQDATPIFWNNRIYSEGETIPQSLQKPNFLWKTSSSDIQSAFSEGNLFVLHRGKGGSNGWTEPYFSTPEIEHLNNGDKLPVVFSLNGNSGNYTDPQCFSEALLRKENGGAVAVFSNGSTSYSGFNDGLALGLIDAIWPNPGIFPNYQTIHGNSFATPDNYSHLCLGDIKNQALLRTIEIWGVDISLIKNTLHSFNLLGDPSMKIWISTPKETLVNAPQKINCKTDTSLSFTSNVDGIATLMVNEKLIAVCHIKSGIGTFHFNQIRGNSAVLTISAENHRPQIINIPIEGGCTEANFNLSHFTLCSFDTLHIVNLSNSHSTVFYWEFGESAIPSSAQGQGPFLVRYETPGIKDIHLTISDNYGIQSIQKSIIVDPVCEENIPSLGKYSSNECEGFLTDNGGFGDYSNNAFGSFTISPIGAAKITLNFEEFNLAQGADKINIYDGPTTNAPLLASLSSSNPPSGHITSNNSSVTIEQQTDAETTASGFILKWNCISSNASPKTNFYSPDSLSCSNEIKFYDLTEGGVESWEWDFGDGTRSNYQNPVHTYSQNGKYHVSLRTTNQFGEDTLTKSEYIHINRPLTPIATDNERCHEGSVELNATSLQKGSLAWYNSETEGFLLGTGERFLTPASETSTPFFVEEQVYPGSSYFGKADSSGEGKYRFKNHIDFLIFDVNKTVFIQSVEVYAYSKGNRKIYLFNSAGEILKTHDADLTYGRNIIKLNWNIQAGINYCIGVSVNNSLYYNSKDLNFPYTDKSNSITIKSSSSTNCYFYFYNWKIRDKMCISPRTKAMAIISDSLEPISAFVIKPNDPNISFENKSKYADSYYWDFGDGHFSLLENPLHTYKNNGNYQVRLIAKNECGKSESIQTISISSTSLQTSDPSISLSLFPNPTNGILYIEVESRDSQANRLALFDLLGQEIINLNLNTSSASLDLRHLSAGMYIIELRSDEQRIQKKILLEY